MRLRCDAVVWPSRLQNDGRDDQRDLPVWARGRSGPRQEARQLCGVEIQFNSIQSGQGSVSA